MIRIANRIIGDTKMKYSFYIVYSNEHINSQKVFDTFEEADKALKDYIDISMDNGLQIFGCVTVWKCEGC